MNKSGLLVVVSGPSGCGKGTVLKQLIENDEHVFYSVSATTRSPRVGEVDGVHYYFISKEQFEEKIASGGMLEYASYVGNYYGTPKSEVDRRIENGVGVVLVIEVIGAANIKRLYPDATLVFIMPPSVEELGNRLRGRGTESEDAIARRMQRAAEELQRVDEYDFSVVNDDAGRCADELYEIWMRRRAQG